ncbi:MAG: CHAP domain-containing protein [bacterium]
MMKRITIFLYLFSLILPMSQTPYAKAVSEQRNNIERSWAYDATAEKAICDSLGGTTGGATGPLYLLGDSIGVGLKSAGLEDQLRAKGFSPTLNVSTGRSISGKGTDPGNSTSGLDAITADTATIKTATTIIIELGTNLESDFGGKIDKLLTSIKSINNTAQIYFIDIAASDQAAGSKNGAYSSSNKQLYLKTANNNYKIISRFKLIYPDGDPQAFSPLTSPKFPFAGDATHVHSTPDGYTALRDLITSTLANTPAAPATGTVPSPSTSPDPNTPATTTAAAVPSDVRQKLLAIKNIGGAQSVDAILNHLDWYQRVGEESNIPWQMLVGVHFREGLHFDNPSNGQGAFQLYSAYQANKNAFPPGQITPEEWVRQGKLAAEVLIGKSKSALSSINKGKTLDKNTTDTNFIKDIMFGYNGKGDKVKAIGLKYATLLNFSPPQDYLFEGAAYVMNFWDASRDGMDQCAVDGCASTNKSQRPGAFLFYAALAGVTSNPTSNPLCTGILESQAGGLGGGGTKDGNQIVSIALAEVGHKEWDSRVLEYTDGKQWAWCASFVSWVYKQNGTPFKGGISGGWLIPAVSDLKSYLEKNGEFHPVGDGYTPQPGDIVIFKSNGASHTGIVEKFENDRFYTIEGNTSNAVKKRDYAITYNKLTGFGRLK